MILDFKCNFKTITEEQLKEEAKRICDFIRNHYKFSMNENKIEIESNEIEHVSITHDGIIVLDSFLIPVTYTSIFNIMKDNFNDTIEENCCRKNRARLFMLFLNGLGITLC